MLTKNFSGLRAVFFPIHREEISRFLPMGLMMFFVVFNYTILRDTKDTLVVNAAGAEALSLIKLFGTVPGAIIVLLIYAKLSALFSKKMLFYVTLTPFILFFSLFAYIIYPFETSLHPSPETVTQLTEAYPRFKTFFLVYGSWSYALFYVFSELWGSVVLSLLFWQFANDFIQIQEAKRFYPLFGMIANFGAVAAGLCIQYFSKMRGMLPEGIDPWGETLHYLMGTVAIGGLMVMGIYGLMNRYVIEAQQPIQKSTKQKVKISLTESFKFLIRSSHLGYIALIVICYGISQNMIEAVWKDQIKKVYLNENAYNAFMGQFSTINGIVTILFMFIGSNVVRIFGWKISAMLTPIMILLTGMLFFSFINFKEHLELYTLSLLAMTPTALAVWIGFSQNSLSKSTKYSLFDPTKEMSYIPLDQESKVKGKAAVDVVGGRLGKSGGSLLQQILLITTGGTLVEISPYLGAMVCLCVFVWLIAIQKLSKSLTALHTDVEEKSQKVVLAS